MGMSVLVWHECPCLAAHILATNDGTVSRIILQTKQSLSYLFSIGFAFLALRPSKIDY